MGPQGGLIVHEILCLFTDFDGYKAFYDKQGLRHREGGPAIVQPNGDREYWTRGVRNRVDGAAFIYGKTREYWVDGKLHREDGPAMYRSPKKAIGMPAVTQYWIDGVQLTEKEFKSRSKGEHKKVSKNG